MTDRPQSRHLPRKLAWQTWAIRLYRLAILAAVAFLLKLTLLPPASTGTVSLTQAQTFFPTAAKLASGDPRLGGITVQDAAGQSLGLLLTTSPQADDLIGYAGPSNLLIALDEQHQVLGVKLLSSEETLAHVEEVKASPHFWKQFQGQRLTEASPKVDAVSGSTLTSLAMAEAIEKRLRGTVTSLRFPEPVTLSEVQSLFPSAQTFSPSKQRSGWFQVQDSQGNTLGFVVRTSPYTDTGHGYKGPTESLVAVDPQGNTVLGLRIRRSYDTPEYVERVRTDEEFPKTLAGRTIKEWAHIDFSKSHIEGVSGATQTSFAVADGIRKRFLADEQTPLATSYAQRWSVGLVFVILGALVLTFTPLRTSRRLRTLWQVALIAAFLFWLGDLLSLSLLAGWAKHGIPWQTAPASLLLVAVALLIPWTTQKQIYCQQLCPHGAAQTWLGKFKRLHIAVPSNLHRWLLRLPLALLFLAILLGLFVPSFELAWLEPFDGWVLKGGAIVSLALAIVGLVASLFVPQAYCRYGCPTGELLRFIKGSGSHDQVNLRDGTAGVLVLACALIVFLPKSFHSPARTPSSVTLPSEIISTFGGQAFGTTWTIKLRGTHDAESLKPLVATEIERIESTLSHWHKDSFTSQFNASQTTFATEQPAELIRLVTLAREISSKTAGQYDITIAPLVDAWGWGPSGPKEQPLTDAQIEQLLEQSGWEKLQIDPDQNTLRKLQPNLQIDLGSLLQGYAADQAGQILRDAGVQEFLIDVGGELLAQGTWQVAIENPQDADHPLQTFTLTDSALATSGLYRARAKIGSETTHHILSPITGRPIQAAATLAAVSAPSALLADAWSTAMLAQGFPQGIETANQQSLPVLLLDLSAQPHVSTAGQSLFSVKAPQQPQKPSKN